MQRVDLRVMLEKDLMRMEGFWNHQQLPFSHELRMYRDESSKALYLKMEALLDVAHNNLALFLLHTRKTRQSRFKFLPAESNLRSHLTAHGAPHDPAADPHLVVLCVASRGYDPQSLEWVVPPGGDGPHEIYCWTD